MADSTTIAKDASIAVGSNDVARQKQPSTEASTTSGDRNTKEDSAKAKISATVSQPSQSQPVNPAVQRIEIQLKEPKPKDHALEAKVVIPWVVAAIGWGLLIILYRLGRANKIDDDFNGIIIDDVKQFLEKIEELTRHVATHQSGCPSQGADLKESREHLTKLRKEADAVSNRIEKSFLLESDREAWKLSFREWKTAIDSDSGLITNKTRKWPREKMNLLDQSNQAYTEKVIHFRNQIATRKIIMKCV